MLPLGNIPTYLQCRRNNNMHNSSQVLEKVNDGENLVQGILICISCGSGKVTRDNHTLHCKMCDHVHSYEAMA